ncbi:glutamate-cysteine ligase family protein [Achromobacter marplatensis]|uniref:glutamate-cysteine ligase family protein n=1 Tax=Achromobacter marplatensis TaxID=470868 RepID=UPI0039F69F86
MEMVVARADCGASHPVTRYFETLARVKRSRGEPAELLKLGERPNAVLGRLGNSGLDNGYNLLETAFHPVTGGLGGLDRLAANVWREIEDVQTALAAEDAVLINASEHPACSLDPDWYRLVCVPRPIYTELVGHRGWLHRTGIDAKAQNSPCTSIPVSLAARALNVVLALSPAAIAIFANSPLQGGRETGLKENRMTMWDRMFRHSRFAGDHFLQMLPQRPFEDLGAYFRWMFGNNTTSRALPAASDQRYKSAVPLYLEDDPSLERFLAAPEWVAYNGVTGQRKMLRPDGSHFVYSQFAHFLDARWRYRLRSPLALDELHHMWAQPGGIEALFDKLGVDGYIEGRAPGAVFPDAHLQEEAGPAISRSVPLAASALQLGLLQNLAQAETLVRDWGWMRLRALRAVAVREALDHDAVYALAQDVLAVALEGLERDERRWLAYAAYCIDTRSTGADRMLRRWRDLPQTDTRVRDLTRQLTLSF